MRRTRWLGTVCGVALLAPAPAAQALSHGGGDTSDAPAVLVAGPSGDAEAMRLLLRERGREMCLELGDGGDPSFSSGGGACTLLPARDLFEPLLLDVAEEAQRAEDAELEGFAPRHAGGAVRANVHTVEYELSGRRRVAIPTVAAPASLAGRRAGRLRFFLGELPREGAVYAVRLLGEDGTLLAVIDGRTGDEGRPPIRGPVRLATGTRGGRWSISATIERRLRPLPGDVGHSERTLCLRASRAEPDGSGGYSVRCFERPSEEVSHAVSGSCSGRRHVVYGVAPTGRVPRAVVLGDGRRVAVRRLALPPSFAVARATAWVAVARRDAAVRSLLLPGGDHVDVSEPPPALRPCGLFSFYADDPFAHPGAPGPGGDAQIAPPGEPAVYVRDGAEHELCIAPGLPTRADECGKPGAWLADTLVNVSSTRRLAAGAVHADVRAVRVTLSDGSRADVATHRGERYTGRYAGRLAFFGFAAPAGRHILAIDLLDERSRPLVEAAWIEPRLAEDARTLVRGRGADGAYRVAVAALEAAKRRDRATCVLVVRGRLPGAGGRCPSAVVPDAHVLTGIVRCRPRAAVLLAGLGRRAASVTARLADGSRRRFAIRREGGRRFAVLAVAPRAGVRAVTVRSRRGAVLARYATPVPPAARQCGYGFWLFAPPR
jgi:hypothetical protein